MSEPLIVDVKRNSLDDGPGIRSVVFFKGCPLRCTWCQNPEALSPRAELQRDRESCLGCGDCTASCPEQIARPAAVAESSEACQRCGACVEACPPAARRIVGQSHSVAALVELLLRDEPFYRSSGGGVTLSGGEPTMFSSFAGSVARQLRERDVHVLLETCGQFSWDAFADRLLPHLSAIYYDVKLAHPEAHRRYTGRDNQRIVANLRQLAVVAQKRGIELRPRVPLVPGITDDEDNLRSIAMLLRELDIARVALLAYNPLWLTKRRALGMELPYAHDQWMEPREITRCQQVFSSRGIEVVD